MNYLKYFMLCLCIKEIYPSDLCPRIVLANGRVRIRSRNRVAKFRCRRNFMMIEGDRFVTCSLGQWRGNVPKCIGSGCHRDFNFPNGAYLPMFGGALTKFECHDGYELSGSNALSCNGRRWNTSTPVCLAHQHTNYECDFENPPMCGWDVDSFNLDYQWIRADLPERSSNDPKFKGDHTLGNSLGHFLLASAKAQFSSSYSMGGFTTRAYSPVLQPFVISPSCATFWVLMGGPTTGILNIYLKPESEELDIQGPETTITGSFEEVWRLVYISLQDMDEPFQLVFEAIFGEGYTTDILIDDFLATTADDCMNLEVEYIKSVMAEGISNFTDDPSDPIIQPITITISPMPLETATEVNTLPERTTAPASQSTKQATTEYDTETTKYVSTTELTTEENTVPTNSSASDEMTTSTIISTSTTREIITTLSSKIPVLETTTVASTSSSTSTSTPKTTPTTTQSTDRPIKPPTTTPSTTTERITTTTTRKPTTTTTTRKPTTTTTAKSTTRYNPKTFKPRFTTPYATISTTEDLVSSTGGNSSKSSSMLIVLIVSVGVFSTLSLLVFLYKKVDDCRQRSLEDDSDIKYLHQGRRSDSEDYQCLEDTNSFIYQPKHAHGSTSETSGMSSSKSTSIASSIDSRTSELSSSSKKKPVRPPPPVTAKDDNALLLNLENHAESIQENQNLKNENQLLVVDLNGDRRANDGRRLPPPVPPRSFGGSSSIL